MPAKQKPEHESPGVARSVLDMSDEEVRELVADVHASGFVQTLQDASRVAMRDRVRPTLFLDFDDVLCLNSPYGGYDVVTTPHPPDLWEKLFAAEPKRVLLRVLEQTGARVVITTSWLMFMERPGFEELFRKTGLEAVADALHPSWEAPADRGMTRHAAIERWLQANHAGEPFAILDDTLSGTGLRGSALHKRGRVLLCEANVGLKEAHAPELLAALAKPAPSWK